MKESSFKAADLWAGVALAALAVYIIAEARRWDYLTPDGPGPGFFPLWYGIAMLALAGMLVLSVVHRRQSVPDERLDWRGTGRALVTWFALAVTLALVKVLGFLIGFALLTFFIVAVMYRRPPRLAFAVAAAASAGFYLVFPFALGVPLPAGMLGF